MTLTVHAVGLGVSGKVALMPSGGTCDTGSDCVVSYPSGTSLSMTANTPVGGGSPGVFSNGTGSTAGCSTSTCAFTITTDSTVTATFSGSTPFKTISVNFTGDGQGHVNHDNNQSQNYDPATATTTGSKYATGSVVTLTATAAPGSRFSGFVSTTNGATVCGAARVCSFTMSVDASITATFHALTALAVAPASADILTGTSQSFTANGTFSNGVTEVVSPVQSATLGVWRTMTPMPTPRIGLAAAVQSSKLYAIGGVGSAPTTLVEVYDPSANAWSTAAPMSTARASFGAASVGGSIYAVAGQTTGAVRVASVERHASSTNTWTSTAPLPTPRQSLAVAELNGILYATGGSEASGVVAKLEAYDPAIDTWTARASMPTARAGHAAVSLNGLLYIVGGKDASGNLLATMDAYDPVTNLWTSRTAMPSARETLAAVVADGVLYAIGGNASGPQSTITAYDVAADTWSFKAFMSTSRAELSAGTIAGRLYAVGGLAFDGVTRLAKNESFTDILRWSSSLPSVAKITQTGNASGLTAGTTTIAASLAGVSCATTTSCSTLRVAAPTPVVMTLSKSSLAFSATRTATSFVSTTAPQQVRMSQSGTGTVTWTAASNVPWLVVSPTSGTGGATLTVSVQFAAGLTASQNGSVTLTFTGSSNAPGPIAAVLTIVPSPATPPFGVFDTPVGDTTVLAGSIAVTGWALDNVGVKRLELWRDLQPGETTPPFASTPTDPRNGKVFISNATFVDNARPDVEALNPNVPVKYRAGWGYLLLTQGLWNQGNGTYKLHAFAFDQEDNVATIGTKTIVVSNAAAAKPFGSIDTPGIGGEASGPNFGWALTPKVNGVATCKIQSNGAQVSIDSGPLQPVVYGDLRTDIQGAFPGFSNSNGAGGNYLYDWSTLTNGTHTIGWYITDDCNRADGIGSRFFQVSSGTNLTAAVIGAQNAVAAPATESSEPITVAHGFGELPVIVPPGEAGSRTIEVTQKDRIEVRVPRGFETAYQLGPDGQRRTLPTGATWDPTSGTLSWQPAPGFLGRYRIVFANGTERISVRIVVAP